MTTTLHKPVKRRTNDGTTIRDKSKWRKIVVTLYPAGFIGLRLEGCRREETLPLECVYERAVKSRVLREHMERVNAKKDKTYTPGKVRRTSLRRGK